MPVLPRFVFALKVLVIVSFGWCTAGALAQEFPTKPVRMVVMNSPGVGPDIASRALAAEMSKFLGQTIVVENRPSGSGAGYEYVAKQTAGDGYTLASISVSDLATLPVLVKEPRIDPLKDLPPLIGIAETRYALVSSPELPWKSFNEMVAYAKANPGKLNYGTSNVGGRIYQETLLNTQLGLKITHVPYSASAAAYLLALRTGEVQMGLVSLASVVAAGDKFRVLALSGEKRSANFSAYPTFSELGFPQIRGLSYSLNVPVGVPKVAFDKLYSSASRALKSPEVMASFAKLHWEISEQTPEVAAKRLIDEAGYLAEVAKRIGIQPQ